MIGWTVMMYAAFTRAYGIVVGFAPEMKVNVVFSSIHG